MFIFTAKINKKRIVSIAAIALIVVAAVLLAKPRGQEYAADEALAGTSAAGSDIRTNDDRLSYILSMGYSVLPDPLSEKEVIIPEQFDATYEQYNALQKECGFDLAPYAGKTVTQYVYSVTGYEGAEDVQLELLVYKNKVIGGSIYTAAVDGFMRGLAAQ